MAETIGVIAGIGRLPYAFTASAKRAGCSVVVIRAVPGAFEDVAESGADAVFDVFCGEWERLVQTLKAQGVGRVYLIGKIARDRLFGVGSLTSAFARSWPAWVPAKTTKPSSKDLSPTWPERR